METKTIAYSLAYLFDPPAMGEKDSWWQLDVIEESCLVETLRYNKIVTNFYRKLGLNGVVKERIFGAFPRVKVLCDEIRLRSERDRVAFREIKRRFSENNIEFMLIKSDGDFPYESDNLDILIRPNMLREVSKLLKEEGYFELTRARERHKFLFRNARKNRVLPLHIHTRVEWEGTQFVDSACLWNRGEISGDDDIFLIPSPEDCILLTCAHLFFENHEVKLVDLFKITSKLRNCNLNWDYMFDHARRLNWNDAFCLTILLVNLVYKDLYGRDMLLQDLLPKIEKTKGSYFKLFGRTLKPFSSGYAPLKIPYTISAFFFLKRVLRESNLSLAGRFEHMSWVASNVLKERIRLAGASCLNSS